MSVPARPGQTVDVLTVDAQALTADDIWWAACHLWGSCNQPDVHPLGCPQRHWPEERRRANLDGMKTVSP